MVVGYAPKQNHETAATEGKAKEKAFKEAEVMPKFPGGVQGLMKYFAKSIKYPVFAQERKEEGKVILQMVIGKEGTLSDIKVLHSASPWLDAEAVRVVSNMPRWEPGRQEGKAIAVEYTLPVVFKLQ